MFSDLGLRNVGQQCHHFFFGDLSSRAICRLKFFNRPNGFHLFLLNDFAKASPLIHQDVFVSFPINVPSCQVARTSWNAFFLKIHGWK